MLKKYKVNRLPQKIVNRIRQIVPSNKAESILHAFCLKRLTTIRANTLKISGWQLRSTLREIGVKLDTVFWYKDAFVVANKSLRELQKLKLYKEGYFYVQNLSSMIPSLILSPKPGEKILDIAASPGGKTTQLSAMMGNSGEIVANEPNPIRMQKLNANLMIQGAANVKLESMHGELIYEKYDEYFDAVLVDAPCSGEGRIHTFEPDSYKYWSYSNIQRYSQIQRKLLSSALLSVKKGGVVVYATCTLSPEENEEVIDWLLNTAKTYVSLEKIYLGGFVFEPGFTSWQGKKYHTDLEDTARIWPNKMMEGFFIAKIRKIK